MPLATRSLAIAEKTQGTDHPNVATSVNNLASIYESQGRYAQAEPLYKRSLEIREKAFGPEHRAVGVVVNNLAGLYVKQGRLGEAEPYTSAPSPLPKSHYGSGSPSRRHEPQQSRLAVSGAGSLCGGGPLFKRDLAIQEKLGLEHPNVAGALNNIALIHHSQGPLPGSRDRCMCAHLPSAKKRSAPIIPMSVNRSSTWLNSFVRKPGMRRPTRSMGAASPSRSARLAPSIPTWAWPSTTSRSFCAPGAKCRSRAPL